MMKIVLILIVLVIAGFLSYKYIFKKSEEVKLEPQPEPQPEPKPQPEPNPDPQPDPNPDPNPEPEPQPEPQPEPEKPKLMKISCDPKKFTLSELQKVKNVSFSVKAVNVPENGKINWSYVQKYTYSYSNSYSYNYAYQQNYVTLVYISDDTSFAYFDIDTRNVAYLPNSITITAKCNKQTRNTTLNLYI